MSKRQITLEEKDVMSKETTQKGNHKNVDAMVIT